MNVLTRAVPALLLLSGATGLIYEVVLARYLTLHLGSSGASQAVTLAVFLGGLSVGALVGGRWAPAVIARLKRFGPAPAIAIAGYALLESFIAVWALGFPTMADLAFAGYHAAAAGMDPSSGSLTVFKLGVAGLLVLPLTVGMGATLPLLATAAERATPRAAVATVSRFYYVNAAGGVAGTLLAGFWLIETLGLIDAVQACAATNLIIALVALRIARRVPAGPDTGPVQGPSREPGGGRCLRRVPVWIVVIAAGLTGYVTLLSEVVWTRIYSLTLGASVYAFPLMLAVVIAGISAGSALATRFIRKGAAPDVVFVWCQIGAALAALFLRARLDMLPEDLLGLRGRLVPTPDNYALWLTVAGTWVGAHLMPAALLLGASFPALLSVASQGGADTGRATGWILGVNTLGNLTGALTGGFLVMPALGVDGSLTLAGVMSLGVGLLVLPRPSVRRGIATAAAAGLGLYFLVVRPPTPLLYQGTFRIRAPEPGAASVVADYWRNHADFVFKSDGKDVSITVQRLPRGHLAMRSNGKPDGSTNDAQSQISLGHLGFLMHPEARDVLVLGLGTGQTAAAVASHPGVDVEVEEIAPEVVEGAKAFSAFNDRVVGRGEVPIRVADGREMLKLAGEASYDMIVSQPPNPWVVGVADLFTLEFFQLCRSRLRSGGVLVQWLQTYEIPDDVFQDVVCTMHAAFPRLHVFASAYGDLALLGRMGDDPIDLDAVERHFEGVDMMRLAPDEPRVARTVDAFLSTEMAGPSAVGRLCQGFTETLSHLRPSIEYRAPRYVFTNAEPPPIVDRLDVRLDPDRAQDTLLRAWLDSRPLTEARQRALYAYLAARGLPSEAPLRAALEPPGPLAEPAFVERALPEVPTGGALSATGSSSTVCGWLAKQPPPRRTVLGAPDPGPRTRGWRAICGGAPAP